jgi:hypothetical protein
MVKRCQACGQPIRERKTTRSLAANAYYWGVVIPAFCELTGYEKDEMHEVLAMHFLRIEDDPLTGAPRRERTPNCSTPKFQEYVDRLRRFGAEMGLYIPDPNEVPA